MSDEPRKKFRLRNLLVNRVAFVDRGANPDADIVLFKRDDDTSTATGSTTATAILEPTTTSNDSETEVDLTVTVTTGTDAPSTGEEGGSMGIDKDALEPEVREFVDGLEAELSTLRGEVETVKADLEKAKADADAETEGEDITKSLTPEAEAIVKAERAKAEALEKRLAEAEERIEKAEVEKADAEFTKRAEDWKHLSLKPEEFGPVLRRIHAADADAAAEVERVLTSANAIASEALTEFGKGGSGPTEALGKLEAMAKSRAAEKGITEAEAYDEVLRTSEGQALYGQHRQEVK